MKGFCYETFSRGYFSSLHVLTVNPKFHVIVPCKALGKNSRESVATLAKRHQAIGAVNGGFWKLNGSPAGILKINHQWYGTPIKPRAAIGWSSNAEKVFIDRILTNFHLKEVQAENQLKVISPVSGAIAKEWNDLEHIVGGTPLLVKNSNIIKDFASEQTYRSFLYRKHSRTAIGIRENGDWVFVVVDQRCYGLLGGISMYELAKLMHSLGCVDALNLDGGGSSTMVVNEDVVNNPCGKIYENGKNVEAVSDAILIVPKICGNH